MRADLHNHTYLCNHANGEPRQYLEAAIARGIDIFGFADHAPMNFDQKYRMSFEQMDLYERMIRDLRDEFSGRIDVRLGYEVDFMRKKELMDERIFAREVDYLIGSVHFLNNWGFDNEEFLDQWSGREIDDVYREYFALICALCKSGKFDILGHMDLIKIFKFTPKKDIRVLAGGAINAIKKSGIVVELNSAGLRKPANEIYPSDALLQMLADADVPITLSSDAHSVAQVALNYDKIYAKAREFGYDKIAVFKNREREFINLA